MQLTANLMGLFVITAKFFCVSLPAAYEHYIPMRKTPMTFSRKIFTAYEQWMIDNLKFRHLIQFYFLPSE